MSWRTGKGRKIASPGKRGEETSQHVLLSHGSAVVREGRVEPLLGLCEAPKSMRTQQNEPS